MAINKLLALEYLKKGYRVFETNSEDSALLIVWKNQKERFDFKKIGLRSTTARLETSSYSLPFSNPHPLIGRKVKIIKEVLI